MMSRTANSIVSDTKLAADRARRAEIIRPPRTSGTARDATRVQPPDVANRAVQKVPPPTPQSGPTEALPCAHESTRDLPAVVAGAPTGGRNHRVGDRAAARRAAGAGL